MLNLTRRELLTWLALTPTLPRFLVRSAEAAAARESAANDRIVVVVRMLGGNDGLNTVVPVRDDRYYRARPSIALARQDTLALTPDLGLHPSLGDFLRVMDQGHAAIVQNVGYAKSSRSHTRSTEIYESGSIAEQAPAEGWLGRYLDHACACGDQAVAGVQFGREPARTIITRSGRTRLVGHTRLLMEMGPGAPASTSATSQGSRRVASVIDTERTLRDTSQRLRAATSGSGRRFSYPDTAFGNSLHWTGNMIETGAGVRVYYVSIGSFETPSSASFDTHVDQPEAHRLLYAELGQGLRAFASHLARADALDRVLLLTFSDFGRQLGENRTRGTDHGDASLMFMLGGRVQAGLLGTPADLGRVQEGGLTAALDFRQVYADILGTWLQVNPSLVLDERVESFPVVERAARPA